MRTWLVVSAAALLVCACTGSSTTSPSGGTTSSTAAPPTTPAATNAAGVRTCVSSSEGPERECALEADTYATEGLVPGLTYTVPAPGWASLNRTVAPGNFHLFPPGGSMSGYDEGTTDAITVVSAVVPPGHCTGEPSETFPGTYRGLLRFLRADRHVVLSNVRDASVGGLEGTVMDVAYADGDGCPDGDYADLMVGVDPSHGAFGVAPATGGLRVFLMHLPGSEHAWAVLVDDARDGGSDYADGRPWLEAAQGVIDTFVLTP
jgi:hypothetical protein